MSDVVDMGRFKKCLELTTTEIFLRYVSECDPFKGKAKGGYFVGRVNVPYEGKKIRMTIDLVPSAALVEKIVKALLPDIQKIFPHLSPEAARSEAEPLAMVFPNLIHHVRFEESGNRACNKEPSISNYSWKLEYIIDEKMVIRKKTCKRCMQCRKCDLDSDRLEVWKEENEEVGTLLEEKMEGKNAYFFRLTKNEGKAKAKNDEKFCVQPLQAKQSGNKPTIDGVLEDRLSDLLADRLSNQSKAIRDNIILRYLNVIKKFYLKKENIWVFRLRVQFRNETGSLVGKGISGDIMDTKNIKSGSMDILHVFNRKSCYTGQREICITSIWDLDTKADAVTKADPVKPKLNVYDVNGEYHEELTRKLNQPIDVIVGKQSVSFLSPPQNGDDIEHIYSEGNTIKILLQRSNGQESRKVTFHYIPCEDFCFFCILDVDGDREKGEKLGMGKRKARPGNVRRTLNIDNKRPKNVQIGKESDSGMSDDASSSCPSRSKTKMARKDNRTSMESDSGVSEVSGLVYHENASTSTSSKNVEITQLQPGSYNRPNSFIPSPRLTDNTTGDFYSPQKPLPSFGRLMNDFQECGMTATYAEASLSSVFQQKFTYFDIPTGPTLSSVNNQDFSSTGPSHRWNAPVNNISNNQAVSTACTAPINEIGGESTTLNDVYPDILLPGPIHDPIQSDGIKRQIKVEVVQKEDVEGPFSYSEETDQIEEPWLEYVDEATSVQYDVSMTCVPPLLIWSLLLLIAATHGLSPSTLLAGLLFLIMAKIMDSNKA